ncbi:MAG: rhodanese-like domain-containing protein [Rhodoferax sp.]
MKFIIDNWTLIALAVISGGLLLVPVLQGAVATGLGPNEAVQLMNREKAVVVDVCEPHEFAAGHVVGARNIPMGELESKLSGAVKNKKLPLILVCQSGARSARAAAVATTLGYEQVHSLGGGLVAWRAANLPVEKA